MLLQATISTNPWCVVGDLNIITAVDDILVEVPYNTKKSIDSIAVIEACVLLDICFSGHKFTW